MTAVNPYPHLPIPAGADEVWEWDDPGTPNAYRCFQACRRVIDFDLGENFERPWTGDIEVEVAGTQYADGTVTRQVAVGPLHPDCPITVRQAEELAAALLEAVQAVRLTS